MSKSTRSSHRFEDVSESNISSQPPPAYKKRRIISQEQTTSTTVSKLSSESSDELLLLVRDLNRFMGVSTQQVRIELLKAFMTRLKEVFSSVSHPLPSDNAARAEIVSYARQIQSTLLLQLGYTLSTMTNNKEDSTHIGDVPESSARRDDEESLTHQESILFLLCQCFVQLYEHMAPISNTINSSSSSGCSQDDPVRLLDLSEFQEVLVLLSQILDQQIPTSSLLTSSSSSPSMSKTLTTCACLQVAWFLATGLGKEYSLEFANTEKILMSLMRVIACGTSTNTDDDNSVIIKNNNKRHALRILEALSVPGPGGTKASVVYTAARVVLLTTTYLPTDETRDDVETIMQSDISIQVSRDSSLLDAKLYALGRAIQTGKQATIIDWEKELMQSSTRHDALLFVQCLAYSSIIAELLARHHHVLLEILHELAVNSKDAFSNGANQSRLEIDASDCLSFIACQCTTNSDDTSREKLVHMLTSVVCKGSIMVQRKAIHGLFRLMNQDIVPMMMSFKHKEYKNITCHRLLEALESLLMSSSAVTSYNMDEEAAGVNADATRLIASIVSFTCDREDFMEEYDDALATLALLLETDHDPTVVHIAVDFIRKHTQMKKHRVGIAQQDLVLTSLSQVAMNQFASSDAKLCAIEAIWNLAQEPANMQIMTRTPSVLDALVQVASTTTITHVDDNNNVREQTRRLSIQTLMHLSTMVCNGRVLAKQVGLLACLIRFVRSLSVTDQSFEKDEMKEQIIKLAMLL